jgi:hypothetical protein
MATTLIVILAVIAFTVIAALLFGAWVTVAFVRLVVRLLGGGGPRQVRGAPPAPGQVLCVHARCHAHNPPAAHFCRRCGRSLGAARAAALAPARRVAMW